MHQPLRDTPSRRALEQVLARGRAILRRVALAETALGTAATFGAALLVALWGISALGFSLELRTGLWVFVALSTAGALAVLFRRRLRPLRRDDVVAWRLEAASAVIGPAMSGELRGAVELARGESSLGGSPELADAHVGWVVDQVERTGALAALPRLAVLRTRGTVAVAVVVVLVFGGLAVFAPQLLGERWAMLTDDEAAQGALAAEARNLLPIVTDLTLTLRFPRYMRRSDQVIQGASGDLVAPRGTEVQLSARADRTVREAALLYGETEVRLSVEDGRKLAGVFTIDAAGAYRFRLTEPDGDVELGPVAHKIVLAPDAVPEVELFAPDEDKTVQLDEAVPLRFKASDDYGLTRFVLVVRRQGSKAKAHEKELKRLGDTPLDEAGSGTFTPEEVGARPGDRLSVYVEAYDNDTVSGPKAGRSKTRVLTVFSAAAHHRELIDLQQQLQDAMVDTLADELEFAVPRQPPRADEERQALVEAQAPSIEHGQHMMSLFIQVLAHLAEDELSPETVRTALVNMRTEIERPLKGKRDLVTNARDSLQRDKKILAYVFTRMRTHQRQLVQLLERHILYLEDLLTQQRLAETEQIAKEMKRTQEAIKDLIQQYKETGDEAIREELLAEIQRLQEQMAELMKRMSELQRDVQDEHLNAEAFNRQHEQQQEAMDLDQMIEEGRLDDALKTLEQMLSGTEQMLQGMQETQEQFGDDEYKELREEMQKFSDELDAVKAEQEELAHRSERLLDAARQKAMEKLEGQLKKKLDELKKKAKKAGKTLDGIDPLGLFGREQENAAVARARLDDLQAALEHQDIEDALQAVREAESSARSAERSVDGRTRGRWGARNPATLEARDRLSEARPQIEEIHDALAEMLPDPTEMLSEGQKQQMQKDANRQQQLQQRAEKLGQQMQQIGEQMPIFGPQHQQQIAEAGQRMREAGEKLRREDLREGRRAQQQALGALGELQEAMQQQGEQQGGGMGGIPMPLPSGRSDGGKKEGNGRRNAEDDVKIPGAEDFQVPEAFRRDILDAMREGAPEEWAPEVKQYYEGLVK